MSRGSLPGWEEADIRRGTHRGIDGELVGLRGLVVQLPDHGDNAAGAVDGEERGGGLEGVEDAAPCAQVGVRGVHDEDGRPHRCVLGVKQSKRKGEWCSDQLPLSVTIPPKPINHVPPANQTRGFVIFILRGFRGT